LLDETFNRINASIHNRSLKNKFMSVLISTKVKGQTEEGYDSVLIAVREAIKQAPGFILHCAHPGEGEWLVYEVWESKAQADLWFGTYVVPNLPEGIHPKRSYQELHSMVTPNEVVVQS
jgi:hypothetical protein